MSPLTWRQSEQVSYETAQVDIGKVETNDD